MKFGSNIAVFIIFFGAALLEALQGKNWILTVIFLALGLLSIYADVKLRSK